MGGDASRAGHARRVLGGGLPPLRQTLVAIFAAAVLVMLGIAALASVRVAITRIAHRYPLPDQRDKSDDDAGIFVGAFMVLPVAGLVGLTGAALMMVMTAGSISSLTAPGLNFPAQMGIWIWLAHELYCSYWARLRAGAAQVPPTT